MTEDRSILTRRVADAWLEAVTRANPLLDADEVRAQLSGMAADLVAIVAAGSFDAEAARALGARLVELDRLQPQDLELMQLSLARSLMGSPESAAGLLPEDAAVPDRVMQALLSLASGFYTAAAQRLSEREVVAVSKIGHDLKTPINAITGFSRVILKEMDGPITELQRQDLTSIYESGQKLLTMVNDLSIVQKLDAAQTGFHGRPFPVADLLADVLRVTQPVAAPRDYVFTVGAAGDLGSLALDATRVRWVLLTLLLHAIRHAVAGQISLMARRDPQDPGWLAVEVSYSVPEGLRAFSGDVLGAGDGGFDGSSDLGLGVCRRFCEELGGTVTRTGARGVTFTVRLPGLSTDPQL